MGIEMRVLRKGLGTMRTHIRTLARVAAQMLLQIVADLKALGAIGALIGPFAGVSTYVHNEM